MHLHAWPDSSSDLARSIAASPSQPTPVPLDLPLLLNRPHPTSLLQLSRALFPHLNFLLDVPPCEGKRPSHRPITSRGRRFRWSRGGEYGQISRSDRCSERDLFSSPWAGYLLVSYIWSVPAYQKREKRAATSVFNPELTNPPHVRKHGPGGGSSRGVSHLTPQPRKEPARREPTPFHPMSCPLPLPPVFRGPKLDPGQARNQPCGEEKQSHLRALHSCRC